MTSYWALQFENWVMFEYSINTKVKAMNDALYIGATGMQAQQMNVDTIANNLVNANTTAFKRSKVAFTDLVTSGSKQISSGSSLAEAGLPGPVQMNGVGVGISSLAKQFDFGELKKTDSQFDVAIQGDGFFEVAMPDGSKAYSRGGTLKVTREGQLATQSGYVLKPGITIPENAQSILIASDGHVQATAAGQSAPTALGQLELVRFTNPTQLSDQGNSLYRATEAAGEPISGDGVGTVSQGFLEASNVKMVDEMVNLMLAQRAYEASVKVVQASDEMQSMVNNLRK